MKQLLVRIACALVLGATLPAWADVSRDQAAAAAQQASGGGRVLSVERVGNAWRVKVVTAQGEVRIILIDAATGRPV
jgi:uncharacterized membrane protein YkoI